MNATIERPGAAERSIMAKKKGRPKTSQRNDVAVKIDAEIIGKAKHVVLARDITLAEYLSDLLRGPVDRDFNKEMKRLAGGEG